MPWQPPIPANALYSRPALGLGAGLALLAWCYDAVQRDGTFKIILTEAAEDMDVEYRTIKRWWAALRAGPFFSHIKDRGRLGYEVRFSDEWIDWRILKARQPKDFQGTKKVLEDAPQVPLKSHSSPEMGIKMSPEQTVYKEDHHDQKTESHGGSEDQDRTRRTHPPAVAALFEIFPDATISVEQTADLCSIVTDLALWREVLVTWKANGYKLRIGNLLDRYRKDATKEYRNGTKPRSVRTQPGDNPERKRQVEADLDDGF